MMCDVNKDNLFCEGEVNLLDNKSICRNNKNSRLFINPAEACYYKHAFTSSVNVLINNTTEVYVSNWIFNV